MSTMNPEQAGFEIDGKRYAVAKNGGMLRGVDVSHHQAPGSFDLTGQDFLIVRAAYGTRPDRLFDVHVRAGLDAGVHVGAYLFYRQLQSREDQLAAFLRTAGTVKLNVAPTVDLEWNTQFDGAVDRERHNTDGRWLVEKLAELYGQAIVYLSPSFWSGALGSPDWVAAHNLWLAHYTKPGWPKVPATAPESMKQWAIHQFQGAPLDSNVCRYLPLITPRGRGPVTATTER